MRVLLRSGMPISTSSSPKKVAIVGYGSQGRAHALNLKVSGAQNVAIALKAVRRPLPRPKPMASRFSRLPKLPPGRPSHDGNAGTNCRPGIYKAVIAPNIRERSDCLRSRPQRSLRPQRAEEDRRRCHDRTKGPGHTVAAYTRRAAACRAWLPFNHNASGNALELALSYACGVRRRPFGHHRKQLPRRVRNRPLRRTGRSLLGRSRRTDPRRLRNLTEVVYAPEMAYFECLHEV